MAKRNDKPRQIANDAMVPRAAPVAPKWGTRVAEITTFAAIHTRTKYEVWL